MPLYDYFCEACKTPSEISHRISEPAATICPACGEPALVKQMSAAAFRLKGGGWYETDFKSDNKRNLADGAGSEPAAKASGGAEGGAGASPAAPPAATPAAAPSPSSSSPSSAPSSSSSSTS